ncbi:MAG: alginate export family protein [Candidatus Scalindua sp.]
MAKNILLIFSSLMFIFAEEIWGGEITPLETTTESEKVKPLQKAFPSPREAIKAKQPESRKPRQNSKAKFDSGAPPKTRNMLTPELGFGARIGLKYEMERNFNLDNGVRDNVYKKTPELSFVFLYMPSEKFSTFLNIQFSRKFVNDEHIRMKKKKKKKDETNLELKQFFLSYKIIDGLNLKVGRQRVLDKREWVYDEEMNAVRLTYDFSKFALELSASEKKDKDLYDSNGRDDKFKNYVFYGRYSPIKDIKIAVYGFVRDGYSRNRKKNPIFYGLQSSGEVLDGLNYWLELAHVRGRSKNKKLRGFGFDLGSTYEFEVPLKPSIVLGYAFGSGDDNPSDKVDRNFRQTGLQDNNAYFNGVTKIKSYGEMLDPELSNLEIVTAGIGIEPMRRASVELIYHYYRQPKLSKKNFDAQIDEDPDGLHKMIGQEIDLVAAYKYKGKKTKIKPSLVLGYFMPGQAFPDNADNSLFAEIKIQFDF